MLLSACVGSAAQAAPFTWSELSYDNALLSQFNLVALGNLTQSATAVSGNIAGRVIVGGNATFSGAPSVCTGSCSGNTTKAIDSTGNAYGALTVFGNLVTPGTNSTTANLSIGSGNVAVKGTSTGNVLMNTTAKATGSFNIVGSAQGTTNIGNAAAIRTTQSSFQGGSYAYNSSTGAVSAAGGTTPAVNQTLAQVFPFQSAYATQAKALSVGLAALPGTQNVKAQTLSVGNGIFFTANNDYSIGGRKYGVVTTTITNLQKETNFLGVDNNGNDATFVIVSGAIDGSTYTLPNLNSYTGSNKVIFDFVDAKSLVLSGNWGTSILAPLATISSMGGTIDGSVIVNTIAQSQALFANNLFVGDLLGLVPEPASLALLGIGLAGAGILRRRRK